MAEISGKITYDKFVDDMLYKLRLPSDEFGRLLKITMSGIEELNLHYFNDIKYAKLTKNTDNNAISLPSDYVSFISLSIPHQGRMWTFTRDEELVITSDGTPPSDTMSVSDGEGINVADNGVVIGVGSRGGVNKYYYKMDRKHDRIIVSGFSFDHAILEYVSTGIETTGTNYIPRVAVRCLEYFVRFMEADYSEKPQSVIYELERRYEKEVRKLKKVLGPSVREIRDAFYKGSSQSVRR